MGGGPGANTRTSIDTSEYAISSSLKVSANGTNVQEGVRTLTNRKRRIHETFCQAYWASFTQHDSNETAIAEPMPPATVLQKNKSCDKSSSSTLSKSSTSNESSPNHKIHLRPTEFVNQFSTETNLHKRVLCLLF